MPCNRDRAGVCGCGCMSERYSFCVCVLKCCVKRRGLGGLCVIHHIHVRTCPSVGMSPIMVVFCVVVLVAGRYVIKGLQWHFLSRSK